MPGHYPPRDSFELERVLRIHLFKAFLFFLEDVPVDRELHALRIKLDTLKVGAISGKKIATIEETIRLIEVTIKEVRTLIFELSSPLLYEVGLKAALEQLA